MCDVYTMSSVLQWDEEASVALKATIFLLGSRVTGQAMVFQPVSQQNGCYEQGGGCEVTFTVSREQCVKVTREHSDLKNASTFSDTFNLEDAEDEG